MGAFSLPGHNYPDEAFALAAYTVAKPMIERELLRNMMEWNDTHRKFGSELIDIDAFARERGISLGAETNGR